MLPFLLPQIGFSCTNLFFHIYPSIKALMDVALPSMAHQRAWRLQSSSKKPPERAQSSNPPDIYTAPEAQTNPQFGGISHRLKTRQEVLFCLLAMN